MKNTQRLLSLALSILFLLTLSLGLQSCSQSETKTEEAKTDAKAEEKTNENKEAENEKNTEQKAELKEIKIKDTYSLSIFDYMTENKDLNDNASFQYSNNKKELYLIVIDESKEELESQGYNLKKYFEFASDNVVKGVKDGKAAEPEKLQIKNYETLQGTVTGKFNNIAVTYLLTIVKTDKQYYQILAWTLTSNKSGIADLKTMINSFKEL
ncbi:MAG: hypothetical protein EAZ55_03065 [Cytophagales bacterium]|nr:MAG: hypothetical protein EAZ55_03065 [Cytophagales bacterium]